MNNRFILTLLCPDRKGIVAAVSSFLLEQDCNILDSDQFDDVLTAQFFMRVTFASESGVGLDVLNAGFGAIGTGFAMNWTIFDASEKPCGLLMVSRVGHCLNDLLYRLKIGALPIEVPADDAVNSRAMAPCMSMSTMIGI